MLWMTTEVYEYYNEDPDFWGEDGWYPEEDTVEDTNTCSASRQDHVVESDNTTTLGECTICFETRPLIPLLKNCWHKAACYDCLRQMLVTHAQQSVRNYPLRCFHPQCRLPICEAQLVGRRLIQSQQELTKHHRLTVLAKGHQGGAKVETVHCPHCDHPRNYTKKDPSATQRRSSFDPRVFRCKECNGTFMVSPHNNVIQALQEFLPDEAGGVRDGWAQCPNCKILISKGDGCDHMFCVLCGLDFSWQEAQRALFRYHAARAAHTDPRSFVHG